VYLINCSFHVFVFVLASHYQTYPYNLSTIWCVIIKTLETFGLAVKKIIKQLVIMNPVNFSLHKSVCALKNTK